MLTQLFGIVWIILGVRFLWKPESFLKRLHKKGRKMMTRFLLGTYIVVAGGIISVSFDISGWWPKLIALILLVVLFKLLLVVRKRFVDQLKEKSGLIDEKRIKQVAILYIIIGGAMFITPQVKRMTQDPSERPRSVYDRLDEEREAMEDW